MGESLKKSPEQEQKDLLYTSMLTTMRGGARKASPHYKLLLGIGHQHTLVSRSRSINTYGDQYSPWKMTFSDNPGFSDIDEGWISFTGPVEGNPDAELDRVYTFLWNHISWSYRGNVFLPGGGMHYSGEVLDGLGGGYDLDVQEYQDLESEIQRCLGLRPSQDLVTR